MLQVALPEPLRQAPAEDVQERIQKAKAALD